MEIGIDSFAAAPKSNEHDRNLDNSIALGELLDRIQLADEAGLDVFGLGEHYRQDYLDSASPVILGAAAARTKRIRLASAVTVLSAADPVRMFQNFATIDLISKGRAEMVVGRGSFMESFPLFGLQFKDYDSLFAEKLELLLAIREKEVISWSGKFRPPITDMGIYPRPLQKELPVWIGVGGTPESFIRAGKLGLPLMLAVIGGETHRFRRLVNLYRQAGEEAGHAPEKLKVGLHSLGYVAKTTQEAKDSFYPGYAETFTQIGRERGWPPVTRNQFEDQVGPTGALVVGSPEEVAAKIFRHSMALGGISRFTFQMDSAGLSHAQLMEAIELIGKEVMPILAD